MKQSTAHLERYSTKIQFIWLEAMEFKKGINMHPNCQIKEKKMKNAFKNSHWRT